MLRMLMWMVGVVAAATALDPGLGAQSTRVPVTRDRDARDRSALTRSRPDFTGTWRYVRPNRQDRAQLLELGVQPARELSVTQSDTGLTSTCTPPSTHPRCGFRNFMTSGGAISGLPEQPPGGAIQAPTPTRSAHSSAGWFGSELVFVESWQARTAGVETAASSYTELWSLDDRGRLQISIASREGKTINVRLLYRRR